MKIILTILALTTIFSCSKEDVTELSGTEWKLTSIVSSSETSNPEIDYILNFDTDSTFTINLDVNDCGGQYNDSSTGSIDFGEGAGCTKVCCDSDFSKKLRNLFSGFNKYSLNGDKLVLSTNKSEANFKLN